MGQFDYNKKKLCFQMEDGICSSFKKYITLSQQAGGTVNKHLLKRQVSERCRDAS